jgi:hypothetical protein
VKLKQIQDRIRILFARWVVEIEGGPGMRRTDDNVVSEVVLLPILSQLFHCSNLRNLNEVERLNYPGIDLADDQARVAFQITATPNSARVKDTLAMFVKEGLYEKYDRLVVYILTKRLRSYPAKSFDSIIDGKFQFDRDRDIVDYRSLLTAISFLQVEDAARIQDLLEANFGDGAIQPVDLASHDYPEIQPYLQRRVCETKDAGPYSLYLLSDEQMHDLADAVTRERRTILLCDAGVGKSTELKRIAAHYSKPGSQFHVELLTLNKYVSQSISEMLCTHWTHVPKDQLLVILDGFDEIESQNRHTAIRRIESFAEEHPEVRLLISCRTNFYNRESAETSGTLQNFSSYTLLDLSDGVISECLTEVLGNRKAEFIEQIADNQLYDLLKSPFYLTRLAELFRENGFLPKTKAQTFEQLIHQSFNLDAEKFRTTNELAEKCEEIIETLERLALAMETLGRNYISSKEYRRVVPDTSSRTLIRYCSLWHKQGTDEVAWQFDHNNFQEYLAARLLARQPLAVIKDFISFEPDYPKIIPSWTNTLSFLLSILDSDGATFPGLIEWVQQIDPEIILQAEPDKIPTSVRESYLKQIFEDYKRKGIAINYEKFSFRQLARFGQSDNIVRYLMDQAEAADGAATLVNALSLLRYVRVPLDQRERASRLFERYATDTAQDGYVCYLAFLALTDHGFNSRELIDRVVSAARSSTDDQVRHGLYYMILNSKCLDDNIDVFLEGIEHAGGVDPTGGSITLGEGLDQAQNPSAVKLILAHIKSRPGLWSRRTFLEDHLPIVVKKAAAAHPIDPAVFPAIMNVLYALSLSYHRKEAEAVTQFFELTKTRFTAFKQVLLDRENCQRNQRDWFDLLAILADEEGLDVFAYLYSKEAVSERDVWAFQNSLGYIRGEPIFGAFNSLINKLSNNQFVLLLSRDRNAEAKEMSRLNFKLLFDKQALKEAVVLIFHTEQANELRIERLDEIFGEGYERGHKYSTMALQSLHEIAKTSKAPVRKDIAIKCIDDHWEPFSIAKICQYMENDPEIVLTPEQRDRVTSWCDANLRKVDFRTAIVTNPDGSWSYSSIGNMLWFFQRRLDLQYPDDVMLDMLSYEVFGESKSKGIEYFEEQLDSAAMAGRILENLEAGIDNFYILKNHLNYCRRHNLADVIPFALRELVSPRSDSSGRQAALETVTAFPDAVTNLEEVLPQITDGFRWAVIDQLSGRKSAVCIEVLRNIMAQGNEGERLRAAICLIEEEQDLDSLRYYVEHVERTKQYPGRLTEKSPLRTLQSLAAFPLVLRLLRLSLDPAIIVADQFNFLYNAVLDSINRIALASRENFEVIKEGLKAFIAENTTQNPNVKSLYSQLDRLERSYYTNLAQKVTVDDVLAKLNALGNNQLGYANTGR